MKLKILLTFCLLLPGLVSVARQNQKWDLESCIEYALINNIQIQQSELNKIQSNISLKGAKLSRLPSLNGSTSYNYSTGRAINPFTNVIENDDIQSQRYSLNAGMTVFNAFAINNTIRQSEIDLAISEYNYEDAKNLTTLNVITFFTNVLLNREQLSNARTTLKTSELRLDQVQTQYDEGASNYQNLLQAKQQVAVDELNLVRAQNSFQLSKLSLQQAMQLPATEDFEIEAPDIEVPDTDAILETPASIYQTALAQQPNIKSAEASVESARLGVKISEANLYPRLTLNAGIGTSYSSVAPDNIPRDGTDNVVVEIPVGVLPSTGEVVFTTREVPSEFDDLTYGRQLDFNQNKFVGLNLNIPIFNGLSARNGVQIARINQQRAELNAVNTKNQLRQNIEQAYQDAKAAAKSYVSATNQVSALTESLKNVQQRRELGAANALEFNQIKNDYDRAITDLTRNKYDYIFKLKILDFYLGKNLSF